MDKIKAKVEGMLHKNDHTDTTTTGTHGTHNTTTTGTTGGLTGSGTHSGIHGDERHGNPSHIGSTGHTGGLTGSTAHSNTHTGNNTYGGSDPTGPHDSKLANKLDPRVDSDQVGSYGNTAGAGGYGTTAGHSAGHAGGLTGNATQASSHNTYGSDPTGPHDSRLGNKADPRVDSDHVGGYGNTGHSGGLSGNTHTGHSGTHTGGGLTGNNTYGSDPTGPHNSHLANQADPRVDSDRVGGYGNTTGHSSGVTGNTYSGHTGAHTGGGMTGGNTYASDPTGPHDSRLANKADPRVDADRVGGYGNTTQTDGFGNATGGGLTGTTAHGNHGQYGLTGQGSHLPGPAQSTAGPHKSDMLNKMDPRVDADLDGSKTYGGNKTYGN